ncbi:hypothetical protein ACFSTE_01030 [Aquimarina hainanensis]|uniref:Uncharacterized protein n=1 Tax=Aquimarina hainanensis TaxID=1578017 RepID=A0ABW5N2L0_9FLAO
MKKVVFSGLLMAGVFSLCSFTSLTEENNALSIEEGVVSVEEEGTRYFTESNHTFPDKFVRSRKTWTNITDSSNERILNNY